MSNLSYEDPVLPEHFQGLSGRHLLGSGKHSPLPWTAAASSPEPMGKETLTERGLQAPLSLWAGRHSQRAGYTFLLTTKAGPVPQVLLANTSGIHSRARGGAAGRRVSCIIGIAAWMGSDPNTRTLRWSTTVPCVLGTRRYISDSCHGPAVLRHGPCLASNTGSSI